MTSLWWGCLSYCKRDYHEQFQCIQQPCSWPGIIPPNKGGHGGYWQIYWWQWGWVHLSWVKSFLQKCKINAWWYTLKTVTNRVDVTKWVLWKIAMEWILWNQRCCWIHEWDSINTINNPFRNERYEVSETFAFCDRFVKLVSILRDLVMDDRECNWDLHLQSIQAVLPLFGDGDRISYLRWGSLSGG